MNTPTPTNACDGCDAEVRFVRPFHDHPDVVEMQVLHDDDCRWLAAAEGRN